MPSSYLSVNVVLDAEARSLMRTTLARLRNAGLEDALVVEGLGIVSGRVPPDKLAALKRVPGVSVQKDEGVSPPPPAEPPGAGDQRRKDT